MNIIKIKGAEEIKLIDSPCVYFLADSQGEILYVGKSKDSMISRIAFHKMEKQFNRSFYTICKGSKEMDDLEAKLIKEINPKYNKIIPTGSEVNGLLKDDEIKKMLKVDRRIIKNSASHFDIPMITIGSRKFYDKSIIKAIEKYINQLKRKPMGYKS